MYPMQVDTVMDKALFFMKVGQGVAGARRSYAMYVARLFLVLGRVHVSPAFRRLRAVPGSSDPSLPRSASLSVTRLAIQARLGAP